MIAARPAEVAGASDRPDAGAAPAMARWLRLAAAPTFGVMALLTGVADGDAPQALCGPAHHPSALGGMPLMYLLMSAFHLAPWLTLFARRAARAN